MGPISSRAIWPKDLPLRRMEKKSVVMSWTAPARMTPAAERRDGVLVYPPRA